MESSVIFCFKLKRRGEIFARGRPVSSRDYSITLKGLKLKMWGWQLGSNGEGGIKNGDDPWSSGLFFPLRSLAISQLRKGFIAHKNFIWGQHLLKTSSPTEAPGVRPDCALLYLAFSCIKWNFAKARLISECCGLFFRWSAWIYQIWALLSVFLSERGFLNLDVGQLFLKLFSGPRVHVVCLCKF